MNTLNGHWQDGKSSTRIPARLIGWPYLNRIQIIGADVTRDYPLDVVRVSARIGNIPRRLEMPDGACFETLDNAAVDALFQQQGKQQRLAHSLESYWGWALGALLVTVAGLWVGVALGIPYLAERVAYAIPTEVDAGMGEQSLQALDTLAFKPSQLPAKQQARGQKLFKAMARARGSAWNFAPWVMESPMRSLCRPALSSPPTN